MWYIPSLQNEIDENSVKNTFSKPQVLLRLRPPTFKPNASLNFGSKTTDAEENMLINGSCHLLSQDFIDFVRKELHVNVNTEK